MYNPYNPYSNPMDRIDNQIKELQNLKKSYQNIPQQPMNVFNVGGNTPQIDFEARILNENERVDEILVQRRTMFFDPFKGKLSIKELNGDIKEYDVILPKTKEQIENDTLKNRIKELEARLNEFSTNNQPSTTNEENAELSKSTNSRTTKNSK